MTKLHQLAELGQAIWLDYIQREFIASGEMQKLIDQGLRGMTSNPTIFEKAISGSQDYDAEISQQAQQGLPDMEIYEALAIADIRQATDLLRPVYDASQGADGYVSLEVNPRLANDTQGTLAEARRLWSQVKRANLMIKIPATKAGLPAITQAIASGINVNVTLIFSLQRYREVIEAYLQGLETRLASGADVGTIASVASFFVSRVDSKVDKLLEAIIQKASPHSAQATRLLGRAAVNNAKLAYQIFLEEFFSQRFQYLAEQGARLQRPLWASTSTKNPNYSDILYVQELIGKYTVNTLPQNTLQAFLDHGEVLETIEDNLERSRHELEALEGLGISMEQVTQELEEEGVAAFANSFEDLLGSIAKKRAALSVRRTPFPTYLGTNQAVVEQALERMAGENILARIWQQDHTVWKPDPKEIRNRLGWLYVAEEMQSHLAQLEALVYAVQQSGYRRAVLLGMGGSSLAPELFARTFGYQPGYLELEVLDSTDPGAVLAQDAKDDYTHTLFIVSTKSGGTEETLSFFKYFYQQTMRSLGSAKTGEHFIAITDPGSKLVEIANNREFRSLFLNDPNIGGRYSALSYFGLVPAALAGVDLRRLLHSAMEMASACRPGRPLEENPAAWLGAILGSLARQGRDKVTLLLSPHLASFGDWVEQLIAESTGKEGKGILPVTGEAIAPPQMYGSDRVFVSLTLAGESSNQTELDQLEVAGHPVVRMEIADVYDLGGQFFLWELATAIAGYFLEINPFDQPNVESAKQLARQMVAAYKSSGALPEEPATLQSDGITVFATEPASDLNNVLNAFLSEAKGGDYLAIQAFLKPEEDTSRALQGLRHALQERTRLATTLGYGPRFLHSTGQLHKGDSGNGLFIQLTNSGDEDVPIPDEIASPSASMSFGVLKMAQALGDRQALQNAGRRVIRLHLAGDIPNQIERLRVAIS